MTFKEENKSFGLMINDISRLLRKVFDNELKNQSTVSNAQWQVIATLGCRDGLSQMELAERIEIEQSSLVRHLDNLENDGLIERRGDKNDRRMKRVYLTEKACPLLDTLTPVVTKLRGELLGHLNETEQEQLMNYLHSIRNRAIEMLDNGTQMIRDNETPANWGLRISILLVIVACGIATYYFTQSSDKPEASAAAKGGPPGGGMPAMSVVAAKVSLQDIAVTIAAVGSIQASESADIHSEIAGKIEKIEFQEGQFVKKGDLLLEIDSSLIKTELTKAQAGLKVNQSTFSRDQELHKSKYIASQELDESKAGLQQAQAEASAARIRLDKARVTAPFDGIVGLRNFSVGDYVNVGQMLTTVDAVDPMKIEFSIPERNFSALHEGQKITFTVDSWPDLYFEGEIYALGSRVDAQTRSFQVKAMVANTENKLRSGMYARLQIATSIHEKALVIPEESILPKGEENFVFVVTDGTATMTPVKTGLRQNGFVEILSGLTEGQDVVTAGALRIRDGAKVMMTAAKPEETSQFETPEEKATPATPQAEALPPLKPVDPVAQEPEVPQEKTEPKNAS